MFVGCFLVKTLDGFMSQSLLSNINTNICFANDSQLQDKKKDIKQDMLRHNFTDQ